MLMLINKRRAQTLNTARPLSVCTMHGWTEYVSVVGGFNTRKVLEFKLKYFSREIFNGEFFPLKFVTIRRILCTTSKLSENTKQ